MAPQPDGLVLLRLLTRWQLKRSKSTTRLTSDRGSRVWFVERVDTVRHSVRVVRFFTPHGATVALRGGFLERGRLGLYRRPYMGANWGGGGGAVVLISYRCDYSSL